jgi:hypothetical protein
MHPSLRIAEIQEIILQNLKDEKPALAALASVCQALYTPSVAALWSSLPSVAPLIRCLPNDLWEEEEKRETWWTGMENFYILVRLRFSFVDRLDLFVSTESYPRAFRIRMEDLRQVRHTR